MRIGVLVLSIGAFGNKGFYNSQEIGLAKELDKLFDDVKVYKLVNENADKTSQLIEGCKNAEFITLPSKQLGSNGIVDFSEIDADLDALICFSDTQLYLPQVYKWAKKNNIDFYPYIGVLKSHSTSPLKRALMDLFLARNIKVYKKVHCFTKTPTVEKELRSYGAKNVTVMPVGLDLSLVRSDYKSADIDELKDKYDFKSDDKVLLFIGRLIDEKYPLTMIDILVEMIKKDPSYKLLMVGTGPLKDQVDEAVKNYHLEGSVKQIESIPNSKIWELYSIADSFVNLSHHEIFGMAVLEAMYYGCKVVAWNAPGPQLIIENNVSGYLVQSENEICEKILENKDISEAAHNRIVNTFTWANTAKKIYDIVSK